VNHVAHEWGIAQSSLNKYVKGDRVPTYQIAKILAREAGIDQGQVLDIIAEEEASKKPMVRMGQLGLALSTLILVSVNLFLTPGTAKAEALSYENTSHQTHTAVSSDFYYVKLYERMKKTLRYAPNRSFALASSRT